MNGCAKRYEILQVFSCHGGLLHVQHKRYITFAYHGFPPLPPTLCYAIFRFFSVDTGTLSAYCIRRVPSKRTICTAKLQTDHLILAEW